MKKEMDMHPKNSTMEIMRQFLAAFVYQDKDTLNKLFAPIFEYHFMCHEKTTSGVSIKEACDLILRERERWAQGRMDVKSWQYDGKFITVKFHVQYGEDIFTEYLEYVTSITIESNLIKSLKMHCTEKKTATAVPPFNKSVMQSSSPPH